MMRPFLVLAVGAATLHAQQTLNVDLGGGQRMEFIRVEPGTFSQGSPEGLAGRGPDELVREVKITRPFYMAKLPVTRGQFARFVQATNFRTEAEKGTSGGFGWESGKLVQNKRYTWRTPGFPQTDEHPVVMVDFTDATAFCTWLSRQSGRKIALPAEAQWEFASLGGGNAGEAWHAGNSPGGTQPAGSNAPNGYGLQDMLGNAWEWCEDWYAPYASGPVADPMQTNKNLSDKPRRVLRGGAFSRPAAEARPAKRFRNDPGSRNADNGFRVVAFDAPVAPAATPPVRPATPPTPKLELDTPPSANEPAPPVRNRPQPASDYSHHHAEPETSSTGSRLGMWAMLGVAGAAIIMILRKFIGSRTNFDSVGGLGAGLATSMASSIHKPRQSDDAFRIRVKEDGFWVMGDVPVGTLLKAEWVGTSTSSSRTFEYRPGADGHFVFTGNRPMSVSVSQVGGSRDNDLDPGLTGMAGLAGMAIGDRDDRDRRAEEEREREERRRRGISSGFPSAY